MSDDQFSNIVNYSTKHDELLTEKTDLVKLIYGLLLVTWLLWIVPLSWVIYHWAF